MKTIVTGNQQSMVDIAMQEYGSAEGVFILMEDNPDKFSSINDRLAAGVTLRIREEVIDTDVLGIYARDKRKVATVNEAELSVLDSAFLLINDNSYRLIDNEGSRHKIS